MLCLARCTAGNLFLLFLRVLAACGQCEGDSASPVPPVPRAAQPEPQEQGLQGKARRWLRLLGKDKEVSQISWALLPGVAKWSRALSYCSAVPVRGLALPFSAGQK